MALKAKHSAKKHLDVSFPLVVLIISYDQSLVGKHQKYCNTFSLFYEKLTMLEFWSQRRIFHFLNVCIVLFSHDFLFDTYFLCWFEEQFRFYVWGLVFAVGTIGVSFQDHGERFKGLPKRSRHAFRDV